MKTSNAIIAIVIVVVVIVAAAGAYILMNPGTTPSSDQGGGGGSNDIRPSGPEGSVNSLIINIAGTNDTNASALTELLDEFNSSIGNSGLPDALASVAVTNNMTTNISLNCSNFTAKLENGSTVRAINKNTEMCEPNATVFIVLGFRTNGTNITSIDFDDGNITFSASWTRRAQQSLPDPVFRTAPNATLSAIDNVTFESLQAWRISKGGNSPIALQFRNESMVLVLMSVTNNNTTALDLKGSDFWLDLGNGTWVQGDDALNNNVPKTVAVNTTVPFLVGFRGTANATPTTAYYWPGAGSDGMMIPIDVMQSPPQGPFVVLKKIWERNATGNNTTAVKPVMVQLWVVGDGANGTQLSSITAWTLRNGQITGIATEDDGRNITRGKQVTVVFNLKSGDDLTMLSYEEGGMTKYVLLRPLHSAA